MEVPFPLTEKQKQRRWRPQKVDKEDAHADSEAGGKTHGGSGDGTRLRITVLAHKQSSGRWTSPFLSSMVLDCAAMTLEVITSLGRDLKTEKEGDIRHEAEEGTVGRGRGVSQRSTGTN